MNHLLSVLIIIICLVSCNRHSVYWDILSQVESYIEERPDSALAVLEQINPLELSDKDFKSEYGKNNNRHSVMSETL